MPKSHDWRHRSAPYGVGVLCGSGARAKQFLTEHSECRKRGLDSTLLRRRRRHLRGECYGENRRIAIKTATNRPAAVPSTSAAPNARFHAADRLLAHENTIDTLRPNTAAATIVITMLVNI